MDIRFDGKRALVTGAGKGIGKAVAIRLAECGAEVIAVSRTQSDLEELEKSNDKIKTVLLDIGNWEKTKATISELEPVDLLVNNAAIAKIKEYGDITEEEVDESYNINLKSIINITQILAKGMKERGLGGSIVNVSCLASFRTGPRVGIYSSSKAAVDQLTRSMATEFGPHNIRVNSVNPSGVRTRLSAHHFKPDSKPLNRFLERTPLKRLGEVDDIAYPILFLLSDYASLISGITLTIDGGLSNLF